MNTVKQVLEILRDLGIVIGIPTLIMLFSRIMGARIDVLKDTIEFLKLTQYTNALTTIQAQKSLHEFELKELNQRLEEYKQLEQISTPNIKEKELIEENIQSVKQSLAQLQRLREDINGNLESEAVRKFENFAKKLNNPSSDHPEHIFSSTTYGDGISTVQANILERKGVIVISDGIVRLTEKGKEIWRELHGSEI